MHHLMLLLAGKCIEMKLTCSSPHSLGFQVSDLHCLTCPEWFRVKLPQNNNCSLHQIFTSPSTSIYFAWLCTNNYFPWVNTQVNEVGQGHCKMLPNQPCRIICLASEALATAAPCSLIHSNEFCFNCFILSAH